MALKWNENATKLKWIRSMKVCNATATIDVKWCICHAVKNAALFPRNWYRITYKFVVSFPPSFWFHCENSFLQSMKINSKIDALPWPQCGCSPMSQSVFLWLIMANVCDKCQLLMQFPISSYIKSCARVLISPINQYSVQNPHQNGVATFEIPMKMFV